MKTFFLFLIVITKLTATPKYEISVLAIFRDEARFLKEWIDFHQLVGIDHFYLLDNLSQDHPEKVLKPYIDKGIVTLYPWPKETTTPTSWPPIQMAAYNHVLPTAKKETMWLAILDTDEFLFPVKKNSLKKLLKDYPNISALAINWQLFGTSSVKRIPPGNLLTETLLLRAPTHHPENRHVKCIVKTTHVTRCTNPHFCQLKRGCLQVTENNIPFTGPLSPTISVDTVRINHYWSRDEDFFLTNKIARRKSWGEDPTACFKRNATLNQIPDTTILRFVPRLRISGQA